jgi:hypothetical protein
MGNVAIKAFYYISKRQAIKNRIPASSTYIYEKINLAIRTGGFFLPMCKPGRIT